MWLSVKSPVVRIDGLLWIGVLLILLVAGCALPGGVNDQVVSGQVKPSPDALAQLPKYSGYETATPVPTLEPEEDERQFLVTDVSSYVDEDDVTVVVGRLENITPFPLDYAVATVNLLDENGEIVASGSGYTLLDVTFPEGANAFRVMVGTDVPAWTDYQIEIACDQYLGDYLNPDLDFSIATAGSSESGGFQLIGEVFNKGTAIAQDVYLLVLLFDKQMNLLDAETVQTNLKVIPVRGASAFEYLWEQGIGVQVGRYEIILQGYR